MGEKTMVEKAGEAVGFGMAMAEDVAGVVKTAVGAAVTTVTGVLKKSPATKAPIKQVEKKAAKKAPVSKAIKKPVTKKAGKKSTLKKAARKAAGRKTATNKPVKKTVKKAARRPK